VRMVAWDIETDRNIVIRRVKNKFVIC